MAEKGKDKKEEETLKHGKTPWPFLIVKLGIFEILNQNLPTQWG